MNRSENMTWTEFMSLLMTVLQWKIRHARTYHRIPYSAVECYVKDKKVGGNCVSYSILISDSIKSLFSI
jgi:hypothetical protein